MKNVEIATVILLGLVLVGCAKEPMQTEQLPVITAKHIATEQISSRQETKPEQSPTPTPTSEPVVEPEPEVNERDLEMLACAIYGEAGADACSDKCRYYVGDVILNRVDDERFPDTIEGVLMQEGQYGSYYWTGIIWPERAQYETETEAVQRAYDTAKALLTGEHSDIYGQGYIWQAEFKQGTDAIYLDGLYFGR